MLCLSSAKKKIVKIFLRKEFRVQTSMGIHSEMYVWRILILQFYLEPASLASLANHVTLARLIIVLRASVIISVASTRPKWVLS